MAFTLVAYTESQSATSLSNMTAVADPHMTVSGDDIIVPELDKIIGYYALGSQCTRAVLSSPSLNAHVLPEIEPIDTGTEPTSNPPYHDRATSPMQLDESEALNFQIVQGTGTFRSYGLVWFADNHSLSIPQGHMFTVRATNTSTLSANAWTNGALTFAQTLPAGKYAIVGMRAQSAGLYAARLVIPGYAYRPGVIGFDADLDTENRRFRYGNMGVFGEFEHNNPPTVDFLSISADTSQVVCLDLIKIA